MATSTIKRTPTAKRDLITLQNITLNSSGQINAGASCALITTNISAHIPSGYKLFYATFRGTQNSSAECWYFEFWGTTLEYRLRNLGNSAITTSPTANIICVKE